MSSKKSRRSKRQVKEVITSSKDEFAMMANIYDKLCILHSIQAHNFIPLTRGYFSHSTNIPEQFSFFEQTVCWIFKFIEHKFIEWDSEMEDPNSISNNIILECKKLGLKKEFPSIKLRQGSGMEVCEILNFLTTVALKHIKYEIKPAVFHKPKQIKDDTATEEMEENENNSESNELSDDESLMEEEMVMDNDSDLENNQSEVENQDNNNVNNAHHINNNNNNKKLFQSMSNNNSIDIHNDNNLNNNMDENEHKTTISIMQTAIKASEWKLEIERVAHALEDRYITGIKEWYTHLSKTRVHSKSLTQLLPDSKAKLTKHSLKLSDLLKRVETKETTLNRQFENLSKQYQIKYNELNQLTKDHNLDIQDVSNSNSKLQELNTNIEKIKIEMKNRNATMTDMRPIKRLKESHTRLKKDLKQLDLRIGVTRQALTRAKLKHYNNNNNMDDDIDMRNDIDL